MGAAIAFGDEIEFSEATANIVDSLALMGGCPFEQAMVVGRPSLLQLQQACSDISSFLENARTQEDIP